jgi:hypothetical protein
MGEEGFRFWVLGLGEEQAFTQHLTPGTQHPSSYRGRLAPSPTGYLHLGHARTFWAAHERARAAGGVLVLRDEDLDTSRARAEFAAAMLEDLRWLGIEWQEGPDVGGPFGPYRQSERRGLYREAWARLVAGGHVYPCICSRRDIARAASAPHEGEALQAQDDEPHYPGTCRPRPGAAPQAPAAPAGLNWRFRVPDGEEMVFDDLHQGRQGFVAGRDFGDFVVWRRDDVPAYQLAVVVDDARMRITEVDHGGRTRRRPPEVHRATDPPPARARLPDARLLPLRPRHRRTRRTPRQAPRVALAPTPARRGPYARGGARAFLRPPARRC